MYPVFSPLHIFLVTLCFRGKCKEKVRPKEADTETISEQQIMFPIVLQRNSNGSKETLMNKH